MDTIKSKTQSSLNISDEVVAAIVKSSIAEIDGVHSLSILPPKYNFAAAASAKSIGIKYCSEAIEINIALIVGMNHKIRIVCEQVQQSVKDAVQNMASVAVSKVNVFVRGVHIEIQE